MYMNLDRHRYNGVDSSLTNTYSCLGFKIELSHESEFESLSMIVAT